jgi:hypothetical protein
VLVIAYSSPAYDVVEVDDSGRYVVSYKNQLQSTNEKNFSFPHHLAADKNNGCILVADTFNNRIVILSRLLDGCAREFNPTPVDGGFQRPSCFLFNESQDRLFVGEMSGQRRVLLFDNVININGNELHQMLSSTLTRLRANDNR